MSPLELSKIFVAIRLLALDFDGTLTDGYVYVDQNGTETVRCSRKDTLNLKKLKEAGVMVIVLSKETNPVVTSRCRKMNIECAQGIDTGNQKLDILKRYMAEHDIQRNEAAFMGDDFNDLECIKFAGIGITVSDGHPLCRQKAEYVTSRRGGDHALREVCDLILLAKGILRPDECYFG